MRELANRCDSKIDEASIIQYVINGIDGPRSDKIILYGATSFSEFKQKLRTYETVIKNMGIHNSNSPNFRHSYESRGRDFKQQSFQRKPTKFNASDAARNPQRCFNCNDIGHLSKSCPNHSRGPRCASHLDIALTDDEPIFHKPRRLPFAERDIVDAQVDEWVKNGIVEPCSSPYASQVVVVKKKDGSKNGFFHVAVNERSRKFTSFVTHNGQYQFRRMPFGLSTCPSTFMRYINATFRHLISKSIVLPYMDDVVIPAANESQALEYLKIVLEVACDYGLEINFKKCQFLHNTIEFLGHIIENGRLFPSPSKTKAVINYPDLKNIKDVRRFLGLTGYFRKFLPSYSTIAKPLSDLLRKDSPFQFYAEQQTAFQKLKYLLTQQPVLSIFNQNSPTTEIHTDASIDGLGAVLLQKSIHDNQFHPVFYMSKKTSDHERKYTSFELEVLAVEGRRSWSKHLKSFASMY
ncbi:retrovirus-related Pol polyprotein from transposon 297 [Trichonephila clavipes]|nr:retrovirus-related Pol polyprotein from transposon 297 [Trichonephila clavipes]